MTAGCEGGKAPDTGWTGMGRGERCIYGINSLHFFKHQTRQIFSMQGKQKCRGQKSRANLIKYSKPTASIETLQSHSSKSEHERCKNVTKIDSFSDSITLFPLCEQDPA